MFPYIYQYKPFICSVTWYKDSQFINKLNHDPLIMDFTKIKDSVLDKYPELKNKSFYLSHWQAKPFTLRQWGLMHYPTGKYITFRNEDDIKLDLKFYNFHMIQEVMKTKIVQPVAVVILLD